MKSFITINQFVISLEYISFHIIELTWTHNPLLAIFVSLRSSGVSLGHHYYVTLLNIQLSEHIKSQFNPDGVHNAILPTGKVTQYIKAKQQPKTIISHRTLMAKTKSFWSRRTWAAGFVCVFWISQQRSVLHCIAGPIKSKHHWLCVVRVCVFVCLHLVSRYETDERNEKS